jgi:hypothetical protein
MRNFYNKGGPTLTKAQQTLPAELKKKILMAEGKKKKTKVKTPRKEAMGIA